jgi:hypothetical protein
MKLTPVTLIAAIAVIGAGGFFIGRLTGPDATAAQTAEAANLNTRPGARAAAAGTASGAPARPGRTSAERRETSAAGSFSTPEERSARLADIVRGENALERNRALLAFIDQLAPGEFEDTVAGFRALGITESRFGEYALLLTAWSEVDPTAALAYSQANTRGGYATGTILTAWANRDPEAAIQWAQATHTGEEANPYMAGIIRGIAGTDPARATELLTSMPRSVERGSALDALLPHMIRQGPDAAREWISAITDEALRDGAMSRATDQLAVADPKGTADWLLANPGEATRRNMDDVLSTWARTDEAGALSYFRALPAGDARTNALRGVVSTIAGSDPARAADLLDRYAGDVNDRVVQNFVWHSYGNDPALAATFIGRITNEEERDSMYRRTLDYWLRNDAAAAQNWLQSNPLPEAVAGHVERRLNELQQRQQ